MLSDQLVLLKQSTNSNRRSGYEIKRLEHQEDGGVRVHINWISFSSSQIVLIATVLHIETGIRRQMFISKYKKLQRNVGN